MTEQKQGNGKVLALSIIGVIALIVAIVGATYAYLAATATSTNISGEAAGGGATITVTKVSTGATGSLIPLDMDTTTLTAAAKGYGNSGSTFDATKACIDKNGYSVCQIYSVVVHNSSSEAVPYDIGVTSLSGTDTANIEVVKMDSNVSVKSATSIKGSSTGIADDTSISGSSDSTTFYIMVFIKNLSTVQTDNGSFSGTVTAVSGYGEQIKADFSA